MDQIRKADNKFNKNIRARSINTWERLQWKKLIRIKFSEKHYQSLKISNLLAVMISLFCFEFNKEFNLELDLKHSLCKTNLFEKFWISKWIF